jgi:chemotaxis response regulator CheB
MPKIRVLIVDDSVTQREIFRRLLADDPERRPSADNPVHNSVPW